ncbi:MAG TPA: twin-arginine translocation signal domain-containing protein, partial [Cyclobacteriaceae bacterium]|nr:twin-arginine translocation signal domain-containing protein [Cyclobacteriaceae bacterium]
MMNQNNKNPRRDFLKTSALLTGGALLSPFAMPGAYAAGSDVIKIAVIGCGGRGTGAVFQALATGHNIKLVAMADAFRDRLDASYTPIAQRHPEKVDVPEEHKFVGFDAYKKAIALADVVLLTAPPGFRPDHFEEAVKQG